MAKLEIGHSWPETQSETHTHERFGMIMRIAPSGLNVALNFNTRRIVCRSSAAHHAAARLFHILDGPLLIALGR